ncbi:MAG: PKD domain-containing protein, partial [Deltaproteobacteria bacterium]|nr:PKD domain-containing protein [Deltaproteobacteria bacterium]
EYAAGDPVNNADPDGLALGRCVLPVVALASICGPDAEGALRCSARASLAAGAELAEGGVPTSAETDRTSFEGGTDLPELEGTGGLPGFGGGVSAPNVAPAISMPATSYSVTLPNALVLSATVSDDGLPAGYPLQKLWYTKQGPAQAVFADPTAVTTSVTFPLGGTYELVLTVSDAEYVTTKTVTVTAIPQNMPPLVELDVPATAVVGENVLLNATVTDDGLPSGYLKSNWSMVSGPGTMKFWNEPPTGPATFVTFDAAGTYVLQIQSTDGALTTTKQVSIAVALANQAPVVSAGDDVTLVAPTMTTTLWGSAVDDGLPEGATLSYQWSVAGGPEGVSFGSPAEPSTTVKFAQPGSYVLRLSVSDGEKVGTDELNATVEPPAGGMPAVSIDLPDDGTITQPTDISASIGDGAWVVEMRRGGRDDVDTPWTILASAVGAASGVLTTFDPTLRLNGLYTIRVSSETSAGIAATSVAAVVEGRMKVGNCSRTFMDLDVPVTGLPIQLLRTYDSRDRERGDFGAGWTLGIRNVRVEKSGVTGRHWYHSVQDLGYFTQYCLIPSKAAAVTVTLPGGKVYRFRAKSEPECQLLEPITTPDIVWTSESYPDAKLVAAGGSSVFAPANPPRGHRLSNIGHLHGCRRDTAEQNPERPVDSVDARRPASRHERRELLAQGQVLQE